MQGIVVFGPLHRLTWQAIPGSTLECAEQIARVAGVLDEMGLMVEGFGRRLMTVHVDLYLEPETQADVCARVAEAIGSDLADGAIVGVVRLPED